MATDEIPDTLDNNKECSETAFGKDPGPINGEWLSRTRKLRELELIISQASQERSAQFQPVVLGWSSV